jgi:hypothetical protein
MPDGYTYFTWVLPPHVLAVALGRWPGSMLATGSHAYSSTFLTVFDPGDPLLAKVVLSHHLIRKSPSLLLYAWEAFSELSFKRSQIVS